MVFNIEQLRKQKNNIRLSNIDAEYEAMLVQNEFKKAFAKAYKNRRRISFNCEDKGD